MNERTALMFEQVRMTGIIPKDTYFTVSIPPIQSESGRALIRGKKVIGAYIALQDIDISHYIKSMKKPTSYEPVTVTFSRKKLFKDLCDVGLLKRIVFELDIEFETSTPNDFDELTDVSYLSSQHV